MEKCWHDERDKRIKSSEALKKVDKLFHLYL